MAEPVIKTKGQANPEVEQTLRALERPLMGQNERLSILRDEVTGGFIYRSVDTTSGKVIHQWPAESMLQFRAYLNQVGAIYDAFT